MVKLAFVVVSTLVGFPGQVLCQGPCLAVENVLSFSHGCSQAGIIAHIEDELALQDPATCSNTPEYEIQVLYYLSNKKWEPLPVAVAWLQTYCPPCLDAGDLATFDHGCEQAGLVQHVEEELAAHGSCGHDAMTEIQVLDYYANEKRTKNDQYAVSSEEVALAWLKELCIEVTPKSCLPADTALDSTQCDVGTVMQTIGDALATTSCSHGAGLELALLTGQDTKEGIVEYIQNLCAGAWATFTAASSTSFLDVDPQFDVNFMTNYVEGRTFLNSERGNFNREKQSPRFPASEESLDAGESIFKYAESGATSTILQPDYPDGTAFNRFESCANNAVMCCWGRDRQSGDGNGNCNANRCGWNAANPKDNTNLCYVESEGSCVTYSGKSEKNAHCHGFIWPDEMSTSLYHMRLNTFFHVAMEDHLLTRGYVEPIDQKRIGGVMQFDAAMCHCIEHMPTVSRADCTLAWSDFQVTLGRDATTGLLTIEPKADAVSATFVPCNGYDPGAGQDANGEYIQANNDLASHAYLLKEEGFLSQTKVEGIFAKLAGHLDPEDNENEEACRVAFCADPACAAQHGDPNSGYTC